MINRRQFLKNSSLAATASLVSTNAIFAQYGLIDRVGLGLFSIPKILDNNMESAIELMASLGYKEFETFGPYSFSTEKARTSWSKVTPQLGFSGSGYFGKTGTEFKKIIKANGITVPSMHTDLDTLSNKMGALAEAANDLGAKYVVLPAIPQEERKTLDDYKRIAALFNKIGAEAKKYGIRYAYHNHGYGLKVENGKMPLDIILEQTSPEYVFFEMDLFWTYAGGADAISLLKKNSGRYKMMHIKDMKESKYFEGSGDNASDWIPLFPYIANAGEGIFDLPTIIKTAKENGMEHFFVEQDKVDHPAIALKKSCAYLRSL